MSERLFTTTIREGVLRLERPNTQWLSTGHAGGESEGPVAYNVTVPEGWPETDLDSYVERRRQQADFPAPGPALLTGVDQRHARRARLDGVDAVVTAGISNPASLSMPDKGSGEGDEGEVEGDEGEVEGDEGEVEGDEGEVEGDEGETSPDRHVGTINVFVGTDRALAPGALANLLTVAAEAKAATLQAKTGFTGTTTDAVVAACDPDGDATAFSGSATPVGQAARACVRDALLASLDSRYADEPIPQSVDDAEYGVVTDVEAEVSTIE